MSELKMFCIESTAQPPSVVMVYGVSKTQAQALYRKTYLTCREATALQIATHIRANLPILGEPAPPNQELLSGDPQYAADYAAAEAAEGRERMNEFDQRRKGGT